MNKLLSLNLLIEILTKQYFLPSRGVILISSRLTDNLRIPFGTPLINININDNVPVMYTNLFNNSGCQNFILNVHQPVETFIEIERELSINSNRFNNRKYLIILAQTGDVSEIFNTKEAQFVLDIILLDFKEINKIVLPQNLQEDYEYEYSFWTHRYSTETTLINPRLLDKWFSKNSSFLRNTNLYPDKLKNTLGGRTLKVGTVKYVPYVIIENTTSGPVMLGAELNILRTFLGYINGSMEQVRQRMLWGNVFENGSNYGLKGCLLNDKIDIGSAAIFLSDKTHKYFDYSNPYMNIELTCLVPVPRLAHLWLSPIYSFQVSTWWAIIPTYIFIGLTVFFLNYLQNRQNDNRSIRTTILIERTIASVVRPILAQGLLRRQCYTKPLLATVLLSTMIISAAYNSGYASIMTKSIYEAPIETVDDFLNSGIRWGGLQEADWITAWKSEREAKIIIMEHNYCLPSTSTDAIVRETKGRHKTAGERYIAASNYHELGLIAKNGNFAFKVERLQDVYHIDPYLKKILYKYQPMKESLQSQSCVFIFRRNSFLIPELNKMLSRMIDSGLVLYWIKEHPRALYRTMILMKAVDSIIKIIFHQYLLHSRCVIFISEINSNSTVNLPRCMQSVNIAVNSSANFSLQYDKIFHNFGCQTFILDVVNPALGFSNIEQGLKFHNESFNERKFVVINKSFTANSVLNIFKTREINFVSDILIIGLKSRTLERNMALLGNYDEIYYLWTHRYTGVKKNIVYELDEWFSVNKSFLNNANLFPEKLENHCGRTYRIGFFQYTPYLIYDKENPIEQNRMKGFEGSLLGAFLKHYNMRTSLRYLYKDYWGDIFDNGTVYGLRGAIYIDEVDIGAAAFFSSDRMNRYFGMTLPTLRLGITCLVPAPKLTAGWLVPVLVYSSLMWKLIFAGYIIITLSIYIRELGFMSRKLKYLESSKYVLLLKKFGKVIFAIFTQYLSRRDILKGYSGTVFITMTLFVTFFLCRSYESGLATIMTIPRYERSINTAEDFLESNISWGGIQVADKLMNWATDKEEKYRRAYRRYLAAPSEAQLKKLVAFGNFGLLIERIPGDHYHFPFPSLEESHYLRLMKEDLYFEYTVFLLRKNSILIPNLNKFIARTQEAGIISRWLDQAAHLATNRSSQLGINSLSHYSSPDRQVVVLRVDHVAGIFCILIAGNVIALLIFCLELFYYSQCNARVNKMHIASASNVVKFHEFPGNALIHTYQPNSKILGSCRSLSWSKDGTWLAVVPHSGSAEIVTVKGNCKLLHTLHDISEPSCASFQNLTKRSLAVGTKHGQVLIYDMKAKSVKARYPRTASAITHVGYTAKDTHCYAGCANGEVLLFNSVAKNLSCTLKVPKSNSITDIKAHVQKRNLLIGGSNEGLIVVWDTNVNKIRFLNEAHKAPVTATIFSPINTSLIVSAGLDRQVCVFDIEKRERITNIPVENNVLSLDFVDDSKYIVMGSQNGKVHIYDTRNLPHPICSFDAHQSAVRHVTYQGAPDDVFLESNSCSLGSIVSEDILRPSKSNDEVQTRGKRTSDFFGMLVQAPSSVSDSYDGKNPDAFSSMEGGDSFIQALGLDKNNTADSVKGEEYHHGDTSGNKLLYVNKFSTLNEHTPNPSRIIHEKVSYDLKDIKQTTSTPKLATENFLSTVSPIVSGMVNQSKSAPNVPGVSVMEIQNVTKEVIHEEVKKALEDLESKVSYQFTHIGHQMRRMILDLHMAILKEFIKVENYCNTIRDEINTEPASTRESYLMEENMNLKKRVLELENQISSLGIRPESEENGNS